MQLGSTACNRSCHPFTKTMLKLHEVKSENRFGGLFFLPARPRKPFATILKLTGSHSWRETWTVTVGGVTGQKHGTLAQLHKESSVNTHPHYIGMWPFILFHLFYIQNYAYSLYLQKNSFSTCFWKVNKCQKNLMDPNS